MFALSKFRFIAKHSRNNYSTHFNKFVSRKKYDTGNLKKFRGVSDFVSIENGSNNLRSQTVLKPARIIYSADDDVTFTEFLPFIIKDLIEDETYANIPEAVKRFSDVLHYNLPNGTKLLGLSTLASYKMLEKPENLTEENIKLANILGWCTELFMTSALLLDDIMDNSETRRHSTCWFKVEGIGLTAINDAIFLENSMFATLKKYFSSHRMYPAIIELFHDSNLKLAYGQCIDIRKPKLEEITIDRFNITALYNASHYVPLLPVTLGMYLSNTYTVEMYRNIKPALFEIGRYVAVENSMWDCFGDTSSVGKIGTDTEEGKCTWLAVVALQKANSFQRKLMEDHYGRSDRKSAEIIRNLYNELDIPGEFEKFKNESCEKVFSQIHMISVTDAMRRLLLTLADKLFNRVYE